MGWARAWSGHRFCVKLRELDRNGRYHIVVMLGEEPRAPYDRVNLTHYYDTRNADELLLAQADFGRGRSYIDLRVNEQVVEIDREGRRVRTASGVWHRYDELVLATGARPRSCLRWRASTSPGSFPYRTIDDLNHD